MSPQYHILEAQPPKSVYYEVCWCSFHTGEHCEIFYDADRAIEWYDAMISRGDNTRVIYRMVERTDYHDDKTPDYFLFFTEKISRETVYLNKKLLTQLYHEKKYQER